MQLSISDRLCLSLVILSLYLPLSHLYIMRKWIRVQLSKCYDGENPKAILPRVNYLTDEIFNLFCKRLQIIYGAIRWKVIRYTTNHDLLWENSKIGKLLLFPSMKRCTPFSPPHISHCNWKILCVVVYLYRVSSFMWECKIWKTLDKIIFYIVLFSLTSTIY